ncbi:MAG: hypothetical protein ACYC5X_02395 [Syntrophales bacterium]
MKKLLIVLLFMVSGTFLCGNALALETYIPHITTGANEWTDYLQANNNASSTATFTLTLYGSTGAQVYSQSHSVGGRSRSQIELKALNSSAATGKITYTETGLVFRVSYASLSGGVAEFKTIDTLGSNIGFYFSDFTSLVQWKGMAIANMGTTNADVTFYALGGGTILQTQTETIAPNAKLLGNNFNLSWLSGLALSQIESIIAVAGSSSLCGIAISGDTVLSRLLFTPAIPVSNFTPQGETTSVSGIWTGTGNSPQTGTLPTTLILSQSGNSVSGTWDGMAVTGTVSGNQLTLTITPFTQSGASITGGASATVTGNSMSGTMHITATLGGTSATINGTFTVTRSGSAAVSLYHVYDAPAGGFVPAAVGAIAK